MSKLLIINADDYGLTPGIARGILDAHRNGVVTSTSVIATGPAFDKTAAWLDDTPTLAVGVHFAAVGEDPPLLSAREIPSLVDARGHFPLTWREFLLRAMRGAIDSDDLRREFGAQLEAILQVGRPLTHADAHQHLHLWPQVRRVVIDLAVDHGIPGVRLPRYTGWSHTAVGVRLLRAQTRRHLRASQRTFTADGCGIEVSGRLTPERFAAILDGFVIGARTSAEITVHPGTEPDPDRRRYDWGFDWNTELTTLCAPGLRARIAAAGFRLGTYADLQLHGGEPVPTEPRSAQV
jgi:predicted glycoside hydrolase/deacetylase ChbG (UPF0249 family)